MYTPEEFVDSFPQVASFLEHKGFDRRNCSSCSRLIFSGATCCNQCSTPRPHQPISDRTFGETWAATKEFMTRRGYQLDTSCSVQNQITLKRTSHRFAGICRFIPDYTDGLLQKKGKILNLQQCIRLDDLANIGTSGRHWTSFNMMGAMRFGKPVGDIELLDDLLALVTQLGYRREDLTISFEPWSDGIHEGMGVECHRGPVQLFNQVYTFLLRTGETLPGDLQYIDTGLGLERCHNGVSSKPVEISLGFDHTRTALALIYAGVYGSKRGAGYTVRRLRTNLLKAGITSSEILDYCRSVCLQNKSLGRPVLDQAEYMNEWVLL